MEPRHIASTMLHLAAGEPFPLPSQHFGTGPPPRLPPAARRNLLRDGMAALASALKGSTDQQLREQAKAAAEQLRGPLRAARAAEDALQVAGLGDGERQEFEACLGAGDGERRLLALLQRLVGDGCPVHRLLTLAHLFVGVQGGDANGEGARVEGPPKTLHPEPHRAPAPCRLFHHPDPPIIRSPPFSRPSHFSIILMQSWQTDIWLLIILMQSY